MAVSEKTLDGLTTSSNGLLIKSTEIKIDSVKLPKNTLKLLREARKLHLTAIGAARYTGLKTSEIWKLWANRAKLRQISEADPTIRKVITEKKYKRSKRLTEEEKKKLLEANERGMARTDAAKFVGVCFNTVTSFWRSEGFKINRGRGLKEEEQEKIFEVLDRGMDGKQTAKHLGIHANTVYRYVKIRKEEAAKDPK